MRRRLAVLVLVLAACTEKEAAEPPQTIALRSPAFADGGAIPARFTCAGDSGSPPLEWSNVPRDARQLVLTVADLDAGDPPFVHWLVLGIDPRSTGAEGDAVPKGGRQEKNDFNRRDWVGPCAPPGERHRYVFTVTASRSPIPTLRDAFGEDAVLAEGRLAATFERR